jgi:hypothetical protein
MKLCGRVPNFCILHVSVSDLYIIMPPILLYCGFGPIAGIYKSFTDTQMQKLGTRTRSFISGNICFAFLVQCSTNSALSESDYCTENSKQIFPERKLSGLVPNFYIHVSLRYLYISMINPQTQ